MFRDNNRVAYYTDKDNITHVADGAKVYKGITLLWTLCGDRDIPADAAFSIKQTEFLPINEQMVTCNACCNKAVEMRRP